MEDFEATETVLRRPGKCWEEEMVRRTAGYLSRQRRTKLHNWAGF
jgi:hypothetical protein